MLRIIGLYSPWTLPSPFSLVFIVYKIILYNYTYIYGQYRRLFISLYYCLLLSIYIYLSIYLSIYLLLPGDGRAAGALPGQQLRGAHQPPDSGDPGQPRLRSPPPSCAFPQGRILENIFVLNMCCGSGT